MGSPHPSALPGSLHAVVSEDWLLACLDTRGCDRSAAAELLDGFACEIVRHDGPLEYVKCVLAARFLDIAAHHELGSSSVDDYARERLGVSGRTLQSKAQIGRLLKAHPAFASAMRQGQISQSKAEVLVRMASADDSHEFVERLVRLARVQTVRALRATARLLALERKGALGDPIDPDDLSQMEGELALWLGQNVPESTKALLDQVVEYASRMSGRRVTRAQAVELAAAEALSGAPRECGTPAQRIPRLNARDWLRPVVSREPVTIEDIARVACECASDVYWSSQRGLAPRLPPLPMSFDLLILARDVDTASAHELDARLRSVVERQSALDYQLGRVLGCMQRRRLYEWGGHETFGRYVADRLGMSASRARMLVRVDRQIWWHDGAVEAYRTGRLSALRLDAMLFVFGNGCTPPEVVTAWVERGQQETLKQFRRELEWARREEECTGVTVMPPPLGAPLVARPVDVEQMSARSDTPARSALRIRVPESVGTLVVAAMQALARPGDRFWQPFERMLLTALECWTSAPRHRNPIFERDGWTCSFPACTRRGNFHEHHIDFRSRGGSNAQSNRGTLCWWHHQEGIHGGRARMRGKAPHHLRFDVGIRPDGPPLMRTLGEVYAPGRSD